MAISDSLGALARLAATLVVATTLPGCTVLGLTIGHAASTTPAEEYDAPATASSGADLADAGLVAGDVVTLELAGGRRVTGELVWLLSDSIVIVPADSATGRELRVPLEEVATVIVTRDVDYTPLVVGGVIGFAVDMAILVPVYLVARDGDWDLHPWADRSHDP